MNNLASKKNRGSPLIGFNLAFPSPDMVEFMGILGFDYVFIDCEHIAFNIESVQACVRAAELTGMLSIARVIKNDPEVILGYLEVGVKGILVPHIKTATDAQAAVDAVKYYPLGKRGAGGRSRAAKYGADLPAEEYYKEVNASTFVLLMIEEAEALKNLPEILEVPGVDYLDFGPHDMALSLGYTEAEDIGQVRELIKDAKEAVRNSDKGYVAPVACLKDGLKAARDGASLIEFDTNSIIKTQAQQFLEQIKNIHNGEKND
ncbi:MAG: hypothetical protein GX603_05275 [Chloroflexi bacterium]|nr:hypothetical protein [Chloroflexota bacterium]